MSDDVRPWSDLARLLGTGPCTCGEWQLELIGCACQANQNLPVRCECYNFLRTNEEIQNGKCRRCSDRELTSHPK